jgi:hypothetical protein
MNINMCFGARGVAPSVWFLVFRFIFEKKVYIAPLHLGFYYRKSGKKYAFGGAQRAKEALRSCIAIDDSIIIHSIEFC